MLSWTWTLLCACVIPLSIVTGQGYRPALAKKPGSGDVRLQHGRGDLAGNVQIYHNGKWGYFCQRSFTKYTAQVICRQLGLVGGSPHNFPVMQKERAILKSINCHGGEEHLYTCSHLQWEYSEDCFAPAGVMCHEAEEGDVRLEQSRGMGRLDVYHAGEWAGVCRENFDTNAAKVACRQLGVEGGSVGFSVSKMNYKAWLKDVRCRGHELRLTDCDGVEYYRQGCPRGQFATVNCKYDLDGRLRLVKADNTSKIGVVQGIQDAQWRPICSWGLRPEQARVICRQMGYGGGSVYERPRVDRHSTKGWRVYGHCTGLEGYMSNCEGYRVLGASCEKIVRLNCNAATSLYAGRVLLMSIVVTFIALFY